jgi:phosphoenolpyruvate synthase/pyruvate phosphate dikinase
MYKQATTKEQPMVKKIEKEERKFCNVALLPEDHDKLKRLADDEQRTMTRQMSVILRKHYARLHGPDIK